MNADISTDLKRQAVQDLISGYASHGWHITTIYKWQTGPPYMVKIDGKNVPTIRATGYSLMDALFDAKRTADTFIEKLSRQEGCSCTDRPCEHCPDEDLSTKRKEGDSIGGPQR